MVTDSVCIRENIAACRRAGSHLSITCGMNPSVKRAVLAIPDTVWQRVTYPTAVPDPDTGELIFDAEVAETPAHTAFAGRTKSEQVTARLIVRRVRDLVKPATAGEQGELGGELPAWAQGRSPEARTASSPTASRAQLGNRAGAQGAKPPPGPERSPETNSTSTPTASRGQLGNLEGQGEAPARPGAQPRHKLSFLSDRVGRVGGWVGGQNPR
ncbi:hypothetical protein [Streptomyces sp. DG1A-41]|uniref:hypothetical protein n=1 Tax=Streptomyces sp. DG1A-41 TaxID=3125779 RepID=UPI0030CBF094